MVELLYSFKPLEAVGEEAITKPVVFVPFILTASPKVPEPATTTFPEEPSTVNLFVFIAKSPGKATFPDVA